MQIQRVNRTDAEKVFIIVRNVTGVTATTGLGMRFLGGNAGEVVSTDGVQCVILESFAQLPQFAGIVARDIADNAYGLVQAWGYVNSVCYSAKADVTVGLEGPAKNLLVPGGLSGTWFSGGSPQAMSVALFKYVQAMATVNISGGVPFGSGFVRAL